ncbi:hypothetical protein HID58_042444 [Brassica napus]|uniref:Uncharacterized protein n=1 Tax=Brassica napus TaxID=3708 RepID=A0ABQ8BDP1_BRANA|nr:hypothetical protein HID58_042444 [Brassica napus]
MPTFSAISLDRMLEPGAASTSAEAVPSRRSYYAKPPISKQEKGKETRPRMSPALYATPDAIPLPNSPSSFLPSPYIINHKSRGPHLLKSSSEANVASSQQKPLEDEAIANGADVKASPRRKSTSFLFPISEATEEDYSNFDFDGVVDGPVGNWSPLDWKIGNGKSELDNPAANDLEWENNLPEPVTAKADKESKSEDLYDPGESASFTSNTDAGEESSNRLATPVGEFYDAWEDYGIQSSINNTESELREIRLSLLMEIEKRKQTEEALEQMKIHWQRLREQLAQVGVFVPIDPTISTNNSNISEELCCQLEAARFVSDFLSRELARRERQKRKKRQRWIWGLIAATITLGSAALAWSYIPASRPSSSEASQTLKDD